MSKKKRQPKTKKPRRPDSSPGGRGVQQNVAALARKNVQEIAAGGLTPPKALELATSAYFLAGHLINRVEAETPLPEPVACQAGCDLCCYNLVEVTAPEALLLGHFVTVHFSPEEKAALQARLAQTLALSAGMDKVALAQRRQNFPCPLLQERRCLAYGVRPLTCRAMHALDVLRCQHEFHAGDLSGSSYYLHRQEITLSVAAGLRAGCRALSLQDGPFSLPQALHDFLSQENPLERWLRGEEVF